MGTSGSYGGSGAADWSAAHDAFDALPNNAPTGDLDAGPPSDGNQQELLDNVGQTLAQALQREDPDYRRWDPGSFSLTSLLPSSRSGGGIGSGGSDGTRPQRLGGGARRQVIKGAARGGAAVAGAYALRTGDAGQLRELGLDLSELQSMGPRAQVARILQAVLGDAGHPDEAALRKATSEHVKAVILSPEPPSPEDSLRGLVAEWIYQISLVELGSQHARTPLTPQEAVRKQKLLRSWLQRRVRNIDVPSPLRMTLQQFSDAAAMIAREALRLLRAGHT